MTLGGVLGTIREASGTFTCYVIAATTGNLIFTPRHVRRRDRVVSVKPVTQGTLTSRAINTFAGAHDT